MKFLNLAWLPAVLGALGVFWFLVFRVERRYYQWIRDHWFYRRSFAGKASSWLYFAGFALLLAALLDPRGPERRVAGKIGDQKTALLIDASASMLAEDVRPNRFEKAALLAKHFIKKAAGHQISVAVFSDGHKRIVPFTKDKDLVEARLRTLEKLDLNRGGTGLSLAIQEAVQYFKTSQGKTLGNILVFTDAEETGGKIETNVPDGISVAVVGIGTAKGGPIPLRDSRGVFRGNKKHNGETVITKLDEDYLKSLGREIEHFRYWVASSYTIPTEEILSFFNRSLKTKMSEEDFRIRPVLANYFLVPGTILLLLAFVLKNFKSFAPPVLAAFVLFSPQARSQTPAEPNNLRPGGKEPPKKTRLIMELEKRFAENELDEAGKKKLAAELLREGFAEQSKKLYQEILPKDASKAGVKERFNLGAAQFKSNDISAGMETYAKLMEDLERNPGPENNALLERAKRNVLKAIQAQAAAKKQQKKNGDQQDESDKSEGRKGQEGERGGKRQDKNKKGGSAGKDGKKNKNKNDKNGQKEQSKQNRSGDENRDDGKDKGRAGKGEKDGKMPSILKQLMSDDNQLQKEVIDADTVKRKTREAKDW